MGGEMGGCGVNWRGCWRYIHIFMLLSICYVPMSETHLVWYVGGHVGDIFYYLCFVGMFNDMLLEMVCVCQEICWFCGW